jgi:hypothetical protein
MQPGYKTTEFYAMLAGAGTVLVSFVQQNCTFRADKCIALGRVVISYIASRAWVKGKALQQPLVIVTPPATEATPAV